MQEDVLNIYRNCHLDLLDMYMASIAVYKKMDIHTLVTHGLVENKEYLCLFFLKEKAALVYIESDFKILYQGIKIASAKDTAAFMSAYKCKIERKAISTFQFLLLKTLQANIL